MNTEKSILITRPQPDAGLFASDLENKGFSSIIEPILAIERVAHQAPDLSLYTALVFTSAQAVRNLSADIPPGPPAMKAFCVGAGTAAHAAALGCDVEAPAAASLENLVKLLATQNDKHRYLYIRGENISRDLRTALQDRQNLSIDEITVYRAVKSSCLSPACRAALRTGSIDAVTLFSRRTAEAFFALLAESGLGAYSRTGIFLCLSPAVLEYVRRQGVVHAYAAENPDNQGMHALIARTLKNTGH